MVLTPFTEQLRPAVEKKKAVKKIAIIGSTGSIGRNALKVIESHPDRLAVSALTAGSNFELLVEQARRFKPEIVCIGDRERVPLLKQKLADIKTEVVCGDEGLVTVSAHPGHDLVLFSVVGARGLKPLVAAIRACKSVAFANKEPFVIAGELIKRLAEKYQVKLLPVDSEHSAIFQCLEGEKHENVRRIILTSSGGPFRNMKSRELGGVTVQKALKHPRWKMGKKITIDSATLMNKGLEVIEAVNLFGLPPEKVEVLIHPEAIIHSLVEFLDGSHIAQLAITDMRIPIQYALAYPERLDSNGLPRLDFSKIGKFTFEKPDIRRFPCLELGYEAARAGGTLPAVLNAANEVAVDLFLKDAIRFTDIPQKIGKVMRRHQIVNQPDLTQILEADAWAREVFK